MEAGSTKTERSRWSNGKGGYEGEQLVKRKVIQEESGSWRGNKGLNGEEGI